MSFCTRCGKALAGAPAFCTRCGNRLRDLEANTPPEPVTATGAHEPVRAHESVQAPEQPYEPERPYEPEPAATSPADDQRGVTATRLGARRGMLAAVAAVLLAVAAGTGWLLYQGHARHALAQNRSHQTLAHPGGQGSGPQPLTQTAVSSSPAPSSPVSSPAPSSPAASSPDGSPSPAGSETGSSVALAPQVLAYGSAHRVGAFVSRYFTTINDRNYRVYTTLYVPGAQPIATESEFKSGYRTTTDSHARLFGLSPTAGGGWAARVSFVSHQDSTQSRTGTSCTAWRITFFLVPSGRSYQIVSPPAGYRSTSRACRAA